MKIKNAEWTPRGNKLLVECMCMNLFWHPANRWKINCPTCGASESITTVRDRYAEAAKAVPRVKPDDGD